MGSGLPSGVWRYQRLIPSTFYPYLIHDFTSPSSLSALQVLDMCQLRRVPCIYKISSI
jgi:hypothetical protein